MPELRSGHIVLRPLRDSDAETLATLANDTRIWENLRDHFPNPYNVEDAKLFIEASSMEDPVLIMAITTQGSLAGVIGLTRQSDVYRKSLEIGYWLGAPFWGKGLATTAVTLITEYAFEKLSCNRLFSGVFSFNKASMRVLEKCGFQKEGIFKKAVWKNGRFWDEHRYARLK